MPDRPAQPFRNVPSRSDRGAAHRVGPDRRPSDDETSIGGCDNAHRSGGGRGFHVHLRLRPGRHASRQIAPCVLPSVCAQAITLSPSGNAPTAIAANTGGVASAHESRAGRGGHRFPAALLRSASPRDSSSFCTQRRSSGTKGQSCPNQKGRAGQHELHGGLQSRQ